MRNFPCIKAAVCGLFLVFLVIEPSLAQQTCGGELMICMDGVAEVEQAYGSAIDASAQECYATCGDGTGMSKFCQSVCSAAIGAMEKAAAKRIKLKVQACFEELAECEGEGCPAGESFDSLAGGCCPKPETGPDCDCSGSKVHVTTQLTGRDGCLESTSCICMRKCPDTEKLGLSTITECGCAKGSSLDPALGLCCPDHVFIPSCAPCPKGWSGGLNEEYNDGGCLVGYSCYCEEPAEMGQCMSDEECKPGYTCTAGVDCLPCASCPECDVCCGMCEPTIGCTEDMCGPKPLLPAVLCEDGTSASVGACEKQADGTCGWSIDQCGDTSCSQDDDCAKGSWCRPLCDGSWQESGEGECVPYQAIGESCGGFTPLCFQKKCEPGVDCVDMNPLIADEPGVCGGDPEPTTCSYGGEIYEVGDNFPGVGDDWCNDCFCDKGGLVGCTKMLCGPQGCETDSDCGEGTWCRPVCNDDWNVEPVSECVPYQSVGEPCGGFTPICAQMKCAPGVDCVDMNPLIADAPGVCGGEGPCDPGVELVNCFVDPCSTASCDAYPKAECVANYCGGCFAEFYENGEQVDCNDTPVTCEVGGQTYLPGDSFSGTGDNWCNTCFCDESGMVACTQIFCGPQGCETNADCPAGEWCRASCDDDWNIQPVNECVPYQNEGESCGGFTLPCAYEQCAEGLQCVAQNELIPDLPGICEAPCNEVQCFVDPCQVTTCDAYPNAECVPNYCGGCNADFYVDGALVDCDDGKITSCDYNGVSYSVGESFNGVGDNWCNSCECLDTGGVSCTKMACGENPCITTGCSGQICASAPVQTTCDWYPEYECYSTIGNCGPFGEDGACMWDSTEALNQCIDNSAIGFLPKSGK